ncbi:hypothetical protein TSACC_2855 [Terrimicrobium sacchariphilum]|uniref:Uncharacterized protein n=1 Tax=Terrimicrobium sacchariphilum TaxID=690879 RepID=A0A146G6Z1_TERSA|nr:hypothetical protein [Terrimicrobium sacchariphilum]GAT32456.1 hypothetical protein TSACC_2855 [Terrimicrobium sacchariphilum]
MHLPARPRHITPIRTLLLTLLLVGLACGTSVFAEEKKAAAPAEAARAEANGNGMKLKIYCDLFSENPLNISVAADVADFSVELPTDNEKEFQWVTTKSAWEGSTLKVIITVERQKYYQITKDSWESRNIGVRELPVSLKPGETVVPVEINGKALRISLVSDGRQKDH